MPVTITPNLVERSQNRYDLQLNLQKNLMTLVESCRSVADLCRKVDVNRQQFNKVSRGTAPAFSENPAENLQVFHDGG